MTIDKDSIKVPFIDLRRGNASIATKALQDWSLLLKNAQFIMGDPVRELESKLAKVCEVKNVIACANGTDAIILSLQAAGIRAGMRVALPNLTFWATFEAVVQIGAVPILIDVDSEHLQLDLQELSEVQKKNPIQACILVHLFGWATPQLKNFRNWCDQQNIVLIEDGAQAFAVKISTNNQEVESVFRNAKIATLSFYPSKVLGGCMDGGAVATNDQVLADRLRCLLNHGRKDHYSYSAVGWNSRMATLQGAFLIHQLAQSSSLIEQRLEAVSYYSTALQELSEQLEISDVPAGVLGNGYLNVVRLREHDPERIQLNLKREGIETARTYPETIHMQSPASGVECSSRMERSSKFCKHVLNLPVFPGITRCEQDLVVDKLKVALKTLH